MLSNAAFAHRPAQLDQIVDLEFLMQSFIGSNSTCRVNFSSNVGTQNIFGDKFQNGRISPSVRIGGLLYSDHTLVRG